MQNLWIRMQYSTVFTQPHCIKVLKIKENNKESSTWGYCQDLMHLVPWANVQQASIFFKLFVVDLIIITNTLRKIKWYNTTIKLKGLNILYWCKRPITCFAIDFPISIGVVFSRINSPPFGVTKVFIPNVSCVKILHWWGEILSLAQSQLAPKGN